MEAQAASISTWPKTAKTKLRPANVLRSDNLSELFGLDLAQSIEPKSKLSRTEAKTSKREKEAREAKKPQRRKWSV